jgi:hypothetical protein
MNVTYRVTLVQLSADASALEPPHHTSRELGELSADAIGKLLENFSHVDVSSAPDANPAIVLRRHGRGWRVTPGNKTLTFHDGLDALSPSSSLAAAGILAAIDPSHDLAATPGEEPATDSTAPARRRPKFSTGQALALLISGLVLLAAGLWFGLHEDDINAIPGDVVTLTAPDEIKTVFASAAGQYLTPVSPGNGVLTLTPTGHFSFATMGPDGTPLPTTYEEQAQAGRRNGQPCVITTVGLIEIVDRDTLNYNEISWHRSTVKHP